MVKLEPVRKMLPNLIKRLQALQGLHSDAAQFSETLDLMQMEQNRLLNLGVNTSASLKDIKNTVEKNWGVISKNMQYIEKRIDEISNKK